MTAENVWCYSFAAANNTRLEEELSRESSHIQFLLSEILVVRGVVHLLPGIYYAASS